MKKIFFDCEFTGLRKNTTLISIGLISDCGKTFYAEFTDYDKGQVDDWIEQNVIKKTRYLKSYKNFSFFQKLQVGKLYRLRNVHTKNSSDNSFICNNTKRLKKELEWWFSQFEQVEMWSDCLSYDWVLFNDIFGTAFDIPKNIYYIPFDICTLFKMKGIDPDISREEFVKQGKENWFAEEQKHNALFDAKIIKMCYNRLINS